MTTSPVNLSEALASFDEIYRPRIVKRVSDISDHVASATGHER